jgi:hypothetical protein
MKMKLLSAVALLTLAAAPAAAQSGGNIHGANAYGEPMNPTYKATAVDPATGYTVGYNGPVKPKVKKKKNKKSQVSTSGSRY